MAAAAAAPRCLSDLPDDLLLRILFLAPAREAASAAVLSRRWRSLCLNSGAVYLDSRSFHRYIYQDKRPRLGFPEPRPPGPPQPPWISASSFSPQLPGIIPRPPCPLPPWSRMISSGPGFSFMSTRDRLSHAVEKAFAAATSSVPITKLTFVVRKPETDARTHPRPDTLQHDLLAAVMSSTAARRVKDLHVEVEHWERIPLSFASLPSESLCILRAVYCSLLTPPHPTTAAYFPRLEELHLHKCAVCVTDLQPITDAAPQLTTLHLESCCLSEKQGKILQWPEAQQDYRLICPAVTAIVLADCSFDQGAKFSIVLDVPRLQSFRYKGAVQLSTRFALLKPLCTLTTKVIQVVDLHLINDTRCFPRQGCILFTFWQFIENFRNAKLLKLRLDFGMDLLATEIQDEFVCKCTTLFDNLERLELDTQYRPGSKAPVVVLASLLHGCPVVRDLQLRLRKDLMARADMRYSIDLEAGADFDKSVDRFRRHRSQMCLLDGEDDDKCEAFDDIPILSEQSFNCLESSLKRVSLQFCMDKPTCLGVQLAKFFAKNARRLEELHIGDGSQKLWEHVNFSVLMKSNGLLIQQKP
ncbi:unnamed protein product [Urochloa humidicola]